MNSLTQYANNNNLTRFFASPAFTKQPAAKGMTNTQTGTFLPQKQLLYLQAY